MTSLWIQLLQWLTTLSYKKITIVLVSILAALLGYSRYELKKENGELLTRNYNLNDSINSIIQSSNRKEIECEERRRQDIQKASEYWRARFEEIEEMLHQDFKKINKR